MKNLLTSFLVTISFGLLVSCTTTNSTDTTVIKITDKSLAMRNMLFSEEELVKASIQEQREAFFTTILPKLKSRETQVFPQQETSHRLRKEEFSCGEVYSLAGDLEECAVLYIHGGSWCWEIDPLHIDFCDKLVDTLNAKVYMAIYPLAPQATYREAYQMLEELYTELRQQKKTLYVMGDSAGGTLTLGLVQRLLTKGEALPDKVVVMAPAPDLTFSNPAITTYSQKDGMLPIGLCQECAKIWTDGTDLTSAAISPIQGNFKGFPDTLWFLGNYDILYPDGVKAFRKMQSAGVHTHLVIGDGFWHVFPIFAINEQPQCLDIIQKFCK